MIQKIAKHKPLALLALTLVTAIAPLAANIVQKDAALAASFCQCTTYVANRFNLTRNFPHAGDWNDGYLQRNNFRQTTVRAGAIVVMERSFPGSDRRFGHVGIVESVSNGRITVRGANQYVGSRLFTEANCSNVRTTAFGTSVNGRSDISFWVR
jgi:surface antigen